MTTLRTCDICGGPLPPGSHTTRKRCSQACFDEARRLSRAEREKKKWADPATRDAMAARHEIHKAKMQARVARLKAAGLCVACGKNPAPDATKCKECSGRRIERRRKLEAKRYKLRQCAECGAGGLPIGDARCEPCLERRRVIERDLRARRVEAGICYSCGENPATPGSNRCQACRDSNAERARIMLAERRESGLCAGCGEPVVGAAKCEACLKKTRDYHNARVAAGLCRVCGQTRDRDGATCSECVKIYRKYKAGGSDASEPEIYLGGGKPGALLEDIEWAR